MADFPRLTLDVDAVALAARRLAERLAARSVRLIGVTKAVDGEPRVGQAMLASGCAGLADSRLPSLARLAAHGLGPRTLIRAPGVHELETTARVADRVLLADLGTARALGTHAGAAPVGVLLTVDLGDRREGVLPENAPAVAKELAGLPGIDLAGISVNFACLSGQLPSEELLCAAEDVLDDVAAHCSGEPLLSLGGTCVLATLRDHRPRFATEVRCGGALLCGYDFVGMVNIDGVPRTDPVLTAVVLESHERPPAPEGPAGRDAFGHVPDVHLPTTTAQYALLDIGRRDCEPAGLRPLLPGAYLAGATSDVSVLITPQALHPGDSVAFAVDYDALVRAVTSPYVTKDYVGGAPAPDVRGAP